MTPTQRQAQQAAVDIYKTLANYFNYDCLPVLPTTYWNACQRLLRMTEKARHRGWQAALKRVEQRLLQVASDCSSHLLTLRSKLVEAMHSRQLLSEKVIADDLLTLSTEFDKVQFDLTQKCITVETLPIVLQDIDLGRFRVVLEWNRLRYHRAYRVIALDPNPAASRSDVTHPHVRGEELCEGDGHPAIRDALHQGRILDFFLLVRQILENYNPNSPHVALENWEGRECSDCGELIRDEGNQFCCASCGDDICHECAVCCDDCGEYFCANHISTCPSCHKSFCRNCLAFCRQCQVKFCKECLDDETCPQCRREAEASDDAADDEQPYDPDGIDCLDAESAQYAEIAI